MAVARLTPRRRIAEKNRRFPIPFPTVPVMVNQNRAPGSAANKVPRTNAVESPAIATEEFSMSMLVSGVPEATPRRISVSVTA